MMGDKLRDAWLKVSSLVTRHSSLRYDHVIFDLDGTLVDSLADLSLAVNHALRSLELPALPVDMVAGYIGEGARILVQRALGDTHQNQFEEALGLFMAHYSPHLLDHTRPYPGVAAMLAELAARRVALSVLSNKPVAMSRAILDGLELSSYFVAVLGGDSLPTRKPDRAGVERLRALTDTPPDRMLLVGDSAIDARTAEAAGVAFCGATWGFNSAGLVGVATPARLIADPKELLAIVEGN